MATAIKSLSPEVRVRGVETVGADAMTHALVAGRPVDIRPSSISSTLGAPNVSQRTLDHVRALIKEVLLVSDTESVEGVLTLDQASKLWVEPAAGCLVPAARRIIEQVGSDARVGLVLCGGNVSFTDVAGWIERFGVSI